MFLPASSHSKLLALLLCTALLAGCAGMQGSDDDSSPGPAENTVTHPMP